MNGTQLIHQDHDSKRKAYDQEKSGVFHEGMEKKIGGIQRMAFYK